MKKWIVRIAIAGVAIIIAVIVIAFLSLNSLVKTGVETIGPKLTQVEVRLNSAKISPFSGSGELNGLFVGNPQGYKTPCAIQVGNVKVKVEVGSVLKDVIVVDSVNIQSPEITIEGGFKENNLTKILDNLNAVTGSSDTEAKPTEKPAEGGKKIKVKDLVISGAQAHVNMTLTGGKTMTLTVPDIHLTDIGTDQNGVSPAELSKKIIKSILEGVAKSAGNVTDFVGKEAKDLGGKAEESVKKASKGLKGLFKK